MIFIHIILNIIIYIILNIIFLKLASNCTNKATALVFHYNVAEI